MKEGLVFATATEDMDALTFGSTVLLRNLTASESRWVWSEWAWHVHTCALIRKLPVREINLDKVLVGLEMDQSKVAQSPPLANEWAWSVTMGTCWL